MFERIANNQRALCDDFAARRNEDDQDQDQDQDQG